MIQSPSFNRVQFRFVIAVLAVLFAVPSFAGGSAQQYVGQWQVDRLRQQHKLPYYPLDCEAGKNIREIVAIDDSTVEVRGGEKTKIYQVGQINGEHYFQSRRRAPVLWEIPSDTFLLSVGVFWDAYRRCETSQTK